MKEAENKKIQALETLNNRARRFYFGEDFEKTILKNINSYKKISETLKGSTGEIFTNTVFDLYPDKISAIALNYWFPHLERFFIDLPLTVGKNTLSKGLSLYNEFRYLGILKSKFVFFSDVVFYRSNNKNSIYVIADKEEGLSLLNEMENVNKILFPLKKVRRDIKLLYKLYNIDNYGNLKEFFKLLQKSLKNNPESLEFYPFINSLIKKFLKKNKLFPFNLFRRNKSLSFDELYKFLKWLKEDFKNEVDQNFSITDLWKFVNWLEDKKALEDNQSSFFTEFIDWLNGDNSSLSENDLENFLKWLEKIFEQEVNLWVEKNRKAFNETLQKELRLKDEQLKKLLLNILYVSSIDLDKKPWKYLFFIPARVKGLKGVGGLATYFSSLPGDKKEVKNLIGFLRHCVDENLSYFEILYGRSLITKEAIKSAISAIMARNMSHNIGSHAFSELVSAGVYEDSNRELYREFYRYIQHRMDFIAQITTETPEWSQPTWFHKEIMRNFYNQFIFLDKLNISEGLRAYDWPENGWEDGDTRGKVIIRTATRKNGEALRWIVDEFIPDSSVSNHYGDISKDDFQIAVPGGIVGYHALYVIIEDFIRNVAKHDYVKVRKELYDKIKDKNLVILTCTEDINNLTCTEDINKELEDKIENLNSEIKKQIEEKKNNIKGVINQLKEKEGEGFNIEDIKDICEHLENFEKIKIVNPSELCKINNTKQDFIVALCDCDDSLRENSKIKKLVEEDQIYVCVNSLSKRMNWVNAGLSESHILSPKDQERLLCLLCLGERDEAIKYLTSVPLRINIMIEEKDRGIYWIKIWSDLKQNLENKKISYYKNTNNSSLKYVGCEISSIEGLNDDYKVELSWENPEGRVNKTEVELQPEETDKSPKTEVTSGEREVGDETGKITLIPFDHKIKSSVQIAISNEILERLEKINETSKVIELFDILREIPDFPVKDYFPVYILLNSKLEKGFIDEIGKLRYGNWGLAEVKISAGYLQMRDVLEIGAEGNYFKEEERVITKIDQFDREKETPIGIIKTIPVDRDGEEISPENDLKDYYLAYKFWVKKPKEIMYVNGVSSENKIKGGGK